MKNICFKGTFQIFSKLRTKIVKKLQNIRSVFKVGKGVNEFQSNCEASRQWGNFSFTLLQFWNKSDSGIVITNQV